MPVATKTQVPTRASTLELAFLVFIWDLVAWGEQGEEEPGGKRVAGSVREAGSTGAGKREK